MPKFIFWLFTSHSIKIGIYKKLQIVSDLIASSEWIVKDPSALGFMMEILLMNTSASEIDVPNGLFNWPDIE